MRRFESYGRHRSGSPGPKGKVETRRVCAAEEIVVDSIIYIVGVVVIVMVVVGYLGFA